MVNASRLRPITNSRLVAFTLVEVALALAIVSFALLVIIGLLPQGIRTNQNSEQESQEVNLLQMVTADRLSTSLATNSYIYQLPPLTGNSTNAISATLWINQDCITTSTSQSANSRFRLNYTAYPVTSVYQPALLNLGVSLANSPTNQPPSLETLVSVLPPQQ